MAQLSISLLGSFQVLWEGRELTSFRSDKERALLAYLVMEAGQPHRREGLLGLLWPDQPEDLARNNLRKSLARLRQTIHDAEADPPFLHITPHSVQFNTDSDYELDVRTFQALLLACQTHPHRHLHTCLPCHERLAQAVHLYRGELLAHSSLISDTAFEEWLFFQRELLARQMQGALAALGLFHEHAGQLPQAEHYVRQQLRLDPWDEAAHQHLLRLLAASGQRPRALSHYEAFRRRLHLELGAEPSEETALLYQRIKADVSVLSDTVAPQTLRAYESSFIGREEEVALLRERLLDPTYRLISVVGEGGVGKTRLALAAAAQAAHDFLDGIRLISLKPAPHPIAITMAQELGLVLDGPEPPQSKLLAYLRAKEMLLLLDGFEQVIDQASFILELLQRAPDVVLLITSREPLNFQRESILRLRGLPVPGQPEDPQAASYSSIRLFAEHAARAAGSFDLDQHSLPQLIQICRYLQGLPLSIELVASWSATLPLPAIAHRLRQASDSLADAPELHGSLQSVFEGSWLLLSDQQRLLLAQCSLFHGRFTLEAAEAVLGATLEEIAALVKKSLLDQPAPGQYVLHDVTRYFAAKKWKAVAELVIRNNTLEQYITFYLIFLGQREKTIYGPTPQQAVGEIREELENIWQAWRRVISADRVSPALLERLGAGGRVLARFYTINGPPEAGESIFHLAVELLVAIQDSLSGVTSVRLLAQFLAYQSHFLCQQGRYEEAFSRAHRAIETAGAQDDQATLALAHLQLGQVYRFQGFYSQARAAFEEALQAAQRAHIPSVEGLTLIVLGESWARLGDYEKALSFGEAALRLCRTAEDAFLEMGAFITLGIIYTHLSNFGQARTYHEGGLRLARQINAPHNVATTLNNLGATATLIGDYTTAKEHYTSSLDLARKMGDRRGESLALGNLGHLSHVMGDHEDAVYLCQQALRISEEMGNPHGSDVFLNLGHALGALGHLDEAARMYSQAAALLEASGMTHLLLLPLSNLASVLVRQDKWEAAEVQITKVLDHLQQDSTGRFVKSARMYLNCYRVLQALGDPRAPQFLTLAHSKVLEIANRIPDSPTRCSFLENVALHREIIGAMEKEKSASREEVPMDET